MLPKITKLTKDQEARFPEDATVEIDDDGSVTVLVGTSAHGQGHETAFAQLVGGLLAVPMDRVRIVHSDTGRVPRGQQTRAEASPVQRASPEPQGGCRTDRRQQHRGRGHPIIQTADHHHADDASDPCKHRLSLSVAG